MPVTTAAPPLPPPVQAGPPPLETTPGSWTAGPVGALLGGLAFGLAGFLGRLTAPDGESAALVWPAAGVAVLWLLLRGAGLLSLDVLVLVAATVLFNAATGAPWPLVGVFVLSNTTMAVLHVTLMRRFAPHLWGCGGQRPPGPVRDLVVMVWTSLTATLVGTTVGYLGLVIVLDVPVTLWAPLLWWGRVLAGTFVVGAAIYMTALELRFHGTTRLREVWSARNEALALVTFSALCYWLVFSAQLPLTFLLLAPTVWVAKRFSTVITTWHTLAGAAVAVVATLLGHGPMVLAPGPELEALLVQALVTLASMLGLFIAFARDDHDALVDRLAETNQEATRQAVLLRSIVDAMHEGLVVVGSTGSIELRNPATARLLGITSLEHADQLTPSLFLPNGDPVPADERPSLRALAGEPVHDEDYLLRRVDGSTARVRVSATHLPPTFLHDRSRVVMVFHDVTAEKAREEELQAFAGTVAHDLHNPLAAIVGWNALLGYQLDTESPDLDSLRDLTARLGRSAERLHELIEGLLEHASSRDRTLDLTLVRLDQVLGRIVESRAVEGQVHWTDLPPVRADQLLVGQVLDNLVGNALKYVAPGVEPDVRVSATTERPGWVTVRVTDNGIGIPDGEHESVFGEFQRAHRGYEGTGLGLSIVQRVVIRHGGSICALPREDGAGTVFEFTLPAA